MFIKQDDRELLPYREPVHEGLDEASKLLLGAAEAIERHGHCNYAAHGLDGSMCVHRALYEAEQKLYNTINGPAGKAARDRLRVVIAGQLITGWSNDGNKEIVVETMRRAALGG